MILAQQIVSAAEYRAELLARASVPFFVAGLVRAGKAHLGQRGSCCWSSPLSRWSFLGGSAAFLHPYTTALKNYPISSRSGIVNIGDKTDEPAGLHVSQTPMET